MTPREACEVMAQEVAHSYGLDHQLLASDPMTYLDYTGNRSFQDTSAQCGESSSAPRQCGINGNVCRANQNSVALLTERVGLADAVMPTIATLSPANNSTVPPGFQVKVSGNDNKIVTGAVLKIDGVQRDMISGAGPFAFTTPALPEGSHTFQVEVSDGKNVKVELRTVTVMIGAPPPPDDDGLGEYGEVAGGCSTGRNQSSGLVIALGLLLASRRRRHATPAA
jgi:RNase P/RNase MRP subunit p29